MRHHAFTMIELIFVIVILGVLAAVAIPKYFAVQNEAQDSVAQAFAVTLTRTVGHSLWSKSIASGANGSIKNDDDNNNSTFYGRSLEVYTTIPRYFDETSVDFSRCVSSGPAQPFITKNSAASGRYNIFCRDGNATTAPYFVASEANNYNF